MFIESLKLLIKIIKRFNVILKLDIKIDFFHNDILTCVCWISPLSLPPQKKRKRFASITCLLPTKTKSKHHTGAINQIFHMSVNLKFFSLKAF